LIIDALGGLTREASMIRRDRTPVRFRLHGIDAPETGQDFGAKGKRSASDLAFAKVVTLRVRDTEVPAGHPPP
jgi:hypothetical protein